MFLSTRTKVKIYFFVYIRTELLVNNLLCILDMQQMLTQTEDKKKSENDISCIKLMLSCFFTNQNPLQ